MPPKTPSTDCHPPSPFSCLLTEGRDSTSHLLHEFSVLRISTPCGNCIHFLLHISFSISVLSHSPASLQRAGLSSVQPMCINSQTIHPSAKELRALGLGKGAAIVMLLLSTTALHGASLSTVHGLPGLPRPGSMRPGTLLSRACGRWQAHSKRVHN